MSHNNTTFGESLGLFKAKKKRSNGDGKRLKPYVKHGQDSILHPSNRKGQREELEIKEGQMKQNSSLQDRLGPIPSTSKGPKITKKPVKQHIKPIVIMNEPTDSDDDADDSNEEQLLLKEDKTRRFSKESNEGSAKPDAESEQVFYFNPPKKWTWNELMKCYPYDRLYDDMLYYKAELEATKHKFEKERHFKRKLVDDVRFYKHRVDELRAEVYKMQNQRYHNQRRY